MKDSDIVFDPSKFPASSASRQTEIEQICSNLTMLDLRDTSVYKPLLFVCEDELVLDYYRESIKNALSSSAVAHIFLHEGDKCNLSHSNDNIFISSMDKHEKKCCLVARPL